MTSTLADGAIANYTDRQAVWPYLSNFAAMGLVRATAITGNSKYLGAAWKWLSWYQAHQSTQGFVTDYTVVGGQEVSTGSMDSTDSYAGTFLLAAREAYRAQGQLTLLRGLAAGIAGAVTAIEATQQSDGLTWAKPTWQVKYLMDQAETYAGLLAAAELAKALGNTTLASRAGADAARMRTGVANLWNASTAAYDWAVHEDGSRVVNKWSVLYSDALSQVWAVAFGLVDAPRAGILAGYFNTVQPKWSAPLATALFDAGTQTVGYWPVAGMGLALVGNVAGLAGATTIRSAALAVGRAWPFTTGNAGQLILLESAGWVPPASPTTTTTTRPSTTTTTPSTTTTSTTSSSTTTAVPPTTSTTSGTTTTTSGASTQLGPLGAAITISPTTTVPR